MSGSSGDNPPSAARQGRSLGPGGSPTGLQKCAQVINPATVSSLLGTVRELLRAEEAREQGLLTRASSLAGFAGLLLPVSIAGGAAIFSVNLSQSWRAVAFGVLAAGLLGLSGTIGAAVIGVNHPRESVGIAIAEVENYPTYAFVTEPPEVIEGRTMRGLIQVLAKERERNSGRARALRWADRLFMGAMFAFVAVGGILGAHALHLI